MRELSLHVLDVVENSLAAEATHITIDIVEDRAEDRLTMTMADNGRGMDEETVSKAVDPFFSTRTTRRIGLGLPLLKAACEHCGGRFSLTSAAGEGTTVEAQFQHSHIDRAPLGNMATSLMSILLSDRLQRLSYRHRVDDRTFQIDTEEVKQALEDVPISHPSVRNWMLDYLSEGEASLGLVEGQPVAHGS